MPRSKRDRAESGIYHIMLRGINKQRIFEDEADRDRFLECLDKSLSKSSAKLYAWCLMNNHVHLLIKEGNEPVGTTVKRFGAGYVGYYNARNGRTGALFQDRFRSEAVDGSEYFLTVLRYIHQNPVKAGLCQKCGEWKYSSCNEYLNGPVRVDDTLLWAEMDRERFREWVDEPNRDACLDTGTQRKTRMSDESARRLLERTSGVESITAFQALPRQDQESSLRKLKAQGATIKQLVRLTGLSYYAIQKV